MRKIIINGNGRYIGTFHFTACGGSSSGETEKSTDTSKVEETSSGDTQAASADSGNKKLLQYG